MTGRPTRRAAAARRAAIIESEDEDDVVANTTKKMEESEDDFTPDDPAPAPTPRPRKSTQPRKSTASSAATPRATPRPSRPRKSVASVASTSSPSAMEASEIQDPDESTATVVATETPAKKAAPRKRKSAAPKKSINESLLAPPDAEDHIAFPTPRQSEEPGAVQGTPLADITSHGVNSPKQSPPKQPSPDDTVTQVKPIKAMDTIMEKPMDIVLKSRNMAMPVVEETGPKNRLVITYLILDNFKSYAGRQEVGPFHASFSSVVGPNGSGKSNVIDSLLFVFGFRASKMRQGKISALIHNSAANPNLDYCEVAVHFQEVVDLVSLPLEASSQDIC